jgi:amino acid adenylation domain-containing protein/non-ribosomal peptide synthase protein (TIGR01720 family)
MRLTREEVDRAIQAVGRAKEIADIYPVSPLQQGVLFQALYAADSSVHMSTFGWRIKGPLDVDAFERAWNYAAERHDILRTAFTGLELTTPLQVVLHRAKVPFKRLDWRELSVAEQDLRYNEAFDADRVQPFDFTRPPLMRITLVRVGKEDFRLLWTFHLLVFDGWSMSTLSREVMATYEVMRIGGMPTFKPAAQYRDFVSWLRKQDSAATEEYWRQTLVGFNAPTAMGIDERSALFHNNIARDHWHNLDVDLESIKSFARLHKITISTLAQGLWALLLSRYSGANDVVFGVTLSGRPADLPGIEAAVGPYISSLPMRLQVYDEMPVVEWLQSVHKRQLELLKVQHSSLARVQKYSDVPAGTPLFESNFIFENYPTEADSSQDQKPHLTVYTESLIEHSGIPLSLTFIVDLVLKLRLTFDTSRFRLEAIERLTGHLQTLLKAVLAEPRTRISRLSALSSAERNKLLIEWNDTAAEYPKADRIFSAFVRQAKLRSFAVALEHEDVKLTYGELNVRANRLAHALIDVGVGRGTIVGLSIERSPQMVVGLLAILKAGAAYVPIDPAYPHDRIRYMLEECKPHIVLTQIKLKPLFQEMEIRLLCLDQQWSNIEQYSDDDPVLDAPDNTELAYIVFTSGSSGRPKGVMGGHRGVVNYLGFIARRCDLTADDVVLNISSISFDASIRDIFGTLSVGAKLVIPSHAHARDSVFLADLIESRRVSVLLSIVPPLLDELSRAAAVFEYRRHSPRLILVSGQALLWDSYRNLTQAYGAQTRLINQYGPTETTFVTTVFTVPLEGVPGERILIGRPILNAKIFLLDANRQLVPIGVPGELYIGGDGVTQGYFNQPKLTAERFIDSPFDAGQRLYRTGDLIRYREDGNLEFLGRIDNQVKIRGFRVEPGEVETSLLKHPDVKRAIVTARQHGSESDQRLVAYVVVESSPSIGELREHLRRLLPEYMIPAAFVFIDGVPLTPNGKVDLRALPPPDLMSQLQRRYTAPETLLEKRLARIWAQALKLERIGIHDNFFDVGGDSIIALQVVSRSVQAGLSMTLKDVFEQETIAQLAALLARDEQTEDSGPVQAFVPMTPVQRWILESNADCIGRCIRSAQFVSDYKLSAEVFQPALAVLIRHHDAFRLRFTQTGVQWQQQYSELDEQMIAAAFEHADLSKLEPFTREEQLKQITSRLLRDFDVSCAPLVRVALIDVGKQDQRVFVVAHRLIMDDYSWAILMEDLQSALGQSRTGATIRFPRKTSSPDRWAERLASFGRTEALRDQGEYWQRQHWDRCAPLPRGLTSAASGSRAVLYASLSESETAALLSSLSERDLSIESAALAAVFEAISKWTGRRVLAIDIENQRREQLFADLDLSRTIGCLSWRYPLVLDSEAVPDSSIDLIAATLLKVPYAGLGFSIAAQLGMKLPSQRAVTEVSFTYALRNFTRQQSLDFGSPGALHHPISVVAVILDGCLGLSWNYDATRFECAAIDSLATHVVAFLKAQVAIVQTGDTATGQACEDADVPLTPIQRMCMDDLQGDLANAIVGFAIDLAQDVSPELLARALEDVVRNHEALRLKLVGSKQTIVSEACAQQCVLFESIDLTGLSEEEGEAKGREAVQGQVASINLASPPLIRAVLIKKNERTTLWMGAHHFAVDPPACQIIQQDLKLAYEQLRCHERVQLPQPMTSFSHWAHRLAALADSPVMLDELQYWRSLPWERTRLLPVDLASDDVGDQLVNYVSASLDAEQTLMLLERVQRKFGAQIDEVLLTALMRGIAAWTGQKAVAVDLMDHGRRTDHFPGEDLSRTVGWFSTRLPVLLEVQDEADIFNDLRLTQEQIRTARGHAIGWGILRYAAADSPLNCVPIPQIRFNHIGHMDRNSFDPNARALFDSETFLRAISSVRLQGLVNVTSYKDNGSLHVHFRYDENRHRRESIKRVATAFHNALITMIATNSR